MRATAESIAASSAGERRVTQNNRSRGWGKEEGGSGIGGVQIQAVRVWPSELAAQEAAPELQSSPSREE